MAEKSILFDFKWDIDKYKSNYDPEYWELCRAFMEIHKTKYPEAKLVHLTEAFYQIGVYGSSYDAKTTRMVSALGIAVLDDFLKLHPGALKHPFDKTANFNAVEAGTSVDSSKKDNKSKQSTSIWDVSVDKTILVNILKQPELKTLFKGFVIIYDIRRASTMNDNKISILEDSFKRSKFGVLHWEKTETNNNVCPIRMTLKWKNVTLAEAEGCDEKALRVRIAQAVLSKMASFSPAIEAKWSYYRDGRAPDVFEFPNMRRVSIYKILRRSQFNVMAEITSYIDTFANSDSFAEIVFGMDFNNNDKKQIIDYVTKSWGTKLTHRTVNKSGVKSKGDTHICVYQIRTGDELRRWLEQYGKENERYRLIDPGLHRRAGSCDSNVREILTTNPVNVPSGETKEENTVQLEKSSKKVDKDVQSSSKQDERDGSKEKSVKKSEEENKDDLEKLLDGFVLFYDANKDSKIDGDDWFTALCNSFEISKFGPLEIVNENIRPLRTKCTFKWKDMILASAEGLTETQAKTAATLQLISKLEPFTYIIQAKEDYFYDGKIPPFVTDPDTEKNEVYRVLNRQALPSYYSIFQTIDEFMKTHSFCEIIFGNDFSWDLKNEIVVYLKAKELDYRFFTSNDEKPPTHLAVYHKIKPEVLKEHLLERGGENEKYKLIPPPKSELISDTTSEAKKPKEKVPERKPATASAPKTTELSTKKSSENSTSKPPEKSISKPAEKSISKPVDKPLSKLADQPPTKPADKPNSNPADNPPIKAGDKLSFAKLAEKRKQPDEPPALEDTNKIMINLKKFKKDKVEYPEDTGGDFPGLILLVGIKKNSTLQRNLFLIMQESFKLSKYGELTVEESEETVWSRKEPLKKCVIKSNRKVIGVGLGDSKTEAKTLAAQQVCKHLRKHCYTVQAKETYFKEGKATPYDFNPDPAKSDIYRVLKRDIFKNQANIIKFVDDFSKKVKNGEVILGEDFTYEEREAVLDYCRKINLSYRLMKCQSQGRSMHTHIAFYHQQPLPTLKADLMSAGGENDMYRLIPPNGKVTVHNSDKLLKQLTIEDLKEMLMKCGGENEEYRLLLPGNLTERDLWPDTLENGSNDDSESKKSSTGNIDKKDTAISLPNPTEITNKIPTNLENVKAISSDKDQNVKGNVGDKDQPLQFGPQPQPVNFVQSYAQAQNPSEQGFSMVVPAGYQPFSVPSLAFQEMPLVFGPQPAPVIYLPVQGAEPSAAADPNLAQEQESQTTVFNSTDNASNKTDLREELAKKRQAESMKKRKVYDMTPETNATNTNDNKEDWSRNVFVSDKEKSDLREKLRQKDSSKEKNQKWSQEKSFPPRKTGRISQERNPRRISPHRDRGRMSPERQRRRFSPGGSKRFSPGPRRFSPGPNRFSPGPRRFSPGPRRFSPGPRRFSPGPRRFSPGRTDRFSPGRGNRRLSPERGPPRNIPREESWSQEERITRQRNSSSERRFPHDIARDRGGFSRSPRRSPSPFRGERFRRSPSRRRDLWDNISAVYSEHIFMYKYVKQDSTTETDPIALLRATKSLDFNIDFEFISHQISIERWQVEVELVTDMSNMHPLVGEGVAPSEVEARIMAAHHAVDTIQKACRVIEPNYNYFAEGGTPLFIQRRSPPKTSVYEIIQNLDPSKPLDVYTVDIMLTVFKQSELEDIFFLATDFSYFERALVIDVANKVGLWWRLFGDRLPTAPIEDIVSTQHVCISKQKSALQLVRELVAKGGSSERYTLVDPRESRITRPREWPGHAY